MVQKSPKNNMLKCLNIGYGLALPTLLQQHLVVSREVFEH